MQQLNTKVGLMGKQIKDANSAFDTYLQLVEMSESPLIFHRWCFISALSTLLARNVWLQFGDDVIYPNQYVILVGPPGTRKSQAIKTISKLVAQAGYEHFSMDSSSKEKFMLDWEHGFDKIYRGVEPGDKTTKMDDGSQELFGQTIGVNKDKVSEVYIKSGELQAFFLGSASEFIVTLTDLWDNPDKATSRFKNSKDLYIPNPTINMLGGCTPTTFSTVFSSNTIGQGMLSRLILVHGGGQRMKLTIPPPMDIDLRNQLIEFMIHIRTKLAGPMVLDDSAFVALDEIYKSWGELPDSRLTTYGSRRLTHLIKLLIVIAASEFRMNITLEDIILGNTILTYTETYMPKALGEFGKSKNSPVSQTVLETIQQGEIMGGITGREIFKAVSQDVDNQNELMNIIIKLTNSSKIKSVQVGDDVVFLPIRKKIAGDTKYINLNLLWEYKLKEAE